MCSSPTKFFFFLITWLLATNHSIAQQQVVLEEFRCYSAVGPMPGYLKDPVFNQALARQIQQILYQERGWQLTDSMRLPVFFPDINQLKKEKSLVVKDRTNPRLHLWIDLIEFEPTIFFGATEEYSNDTIVAKRSSSVIRISYYLLNNQNALVEKNELDISLSQAASPAMGILFNGLLEEGLSYFVCTTARGFREAIAKSMQIIFNKENNTSLIELKVPPAFYYNNFIPQNATQLFPIVKTEFKNNSFRFTTEKNIHLLRNGEIQVVEVWVKGKRKEGFPTYLFDSLRPIRKQGETDFVCLQHVMRDVLNDISYEARFFGISNQATVLEGEFPLVEKSVHYILDKSDTVARFTIQQNPRLDEPEMIWLNRTYNGLDSATVFNFDPVPKIALLPTQIELRGTLWGQNFHIRIRGSHQNWKDIWLDDHLVMRLQGKGIPDKFMITRAVPDLRIQNLLLLLATSPVLDLL